jgi:hypothetical protein
MPTDLPFDDPLTFAEMSQSLCGGVGVTGQRVDRFVEANTPLDSWTNDRGMTILHIAASYGNRYALTAFVRAGADLSRRDKLGWTPLHYAVDHDFVIATQDGELPSKLPTADLCLKLGADPTIKNNDGKTAGELFARIAGMPEVLLGIGLIATEG